MSEQSNRSPEEIRAILHRVAAGELDADQASRMLAGDPAAQSPQTARHHSANSEPSYDDAYWSAKRPAPAPQRPADSERTAESGQPAESANSERSAESAPSEQPAEPDRPAEPGGRPDEGFGDLAARAQEVARSMTDWLGGTAKSGSGDAWAQATRVPHDDSTDGAHDFTSGQEPVSEPPGTVAEPPTGTAAGPTGEPAGQQTEPADRTPMVTELQRVTVRAVGRRVRIIGEPAVQGVAVDGPHQVTRDGNTISIGSDGDMGVSIDGISMLRTRNLDDVKSQVGNLARELSVRVNPRLEVEVEVTGGSVTCSRVPALRRARVTGGTVRISDVSGPLDVLVQAGSAQLDTRLTNGQSRIRIESGTANLTLEHGSDVRVRSDAQLGRITWTGAVSGQSRDVEIGRGRARLDLEVLVGSVQVAAD